MFSDDNEMHVFLHILQNHNKNSTNFISELIPLMSKLFFSKDHFQGIYFIINSNIVLL